MNTFAYDLHLHSALSPCAQEDMTPGNLAGMAQVAELRVAALTDHDSCGNCPAFFSACEAYGIVPIAGMELTTAEDIHLICLFPALETAMTFDGAVQDRRLRMPNRPELFGEQVLFDTQDRIIGSEPDYLPAATDLTLNEAMLLVTAHGGVCYPAHIDREGNGILAILGDFPETPAFAAVEIARANNAALAGGRMILCCSDAHRLWEIGNREQKIELDVERDAPADIIRKALFAALRGNIPLCEGVPKGRGGL